MGAILIKARDYFFYSFLMLVGAWLIFALGLMIYSLYLEFSGNDEKLQQMSNEFSWKFDGTFKNSPGNIWYEGPKDIAIGAITNKVQIGNLAGNRKLEFGVKNILEEVFQEREISLDPTSKNILKVDIVYLDVLKTQSSLSIVHNNKESVVIRLQGFLYKDGKLEKKFLVEESADEISMSTLLVDEGGKFNNQNLSSALKKACSSLVTKIIEDKK
jgi:hypothetical protein